MTETTGRLPSESNLPVDGGVFDTEAAYNLRSVMIHDLHWGRHPDVLNQADIAELTGVEPEFGFDSVQFWAPDRDQEGSHNLDVQVIFRRDVGEGVEGLAYLIPAYFEGSIVKQPFSVVNGEVHTDESKTVSDPSEVSQKLAGFTELYEGAKILERKIARDNSVTRKVIGRFATLFSRSRS